VKTRLENAGTGKNLAQNLFVFKKTHLKHIQKFCHILMKDRCRTAVSGALNKKAIFTTRIG
jgi:hypothetical protein